jgi:OOP family OmpA-OmpF porin
VFVIEKSGLLLSHTSRSEDENIDPDVMAGMLTAIMNFARTSFAEGSDELRRLELGERTIVIERSPGFIVAIAVAGSAPVEMREEMRVFLDRVEKRYGAMMSKWSGDTTAVAGLQAMTSRLFL